MSSSTDAIEAVKSLAVDHGTASQPAPKGSSGMTDLAKNWPLGMHRDRLLRIVKGTGAGQSRVISDNTETTLVIQAPWAIALGATSVYVIL